MERTMSVEDKIRRAEEIYYRRRQQEIPKREVENRPVKSKRNIKLLKKMIKQILICLLIYTIFYIIINNNYIFSEDFSNKAREILNQDIDFLKVYNYIMTKIEEIQLPKTEEEQIQNNEENIGGAVEILVPEENATAEKIQEQETSEQEILAKEPLTQEKPSEEVQDIQEEQKVETLSQMEQDANYIKNTISFIKPITGKISSIFGLRNPTTSTVPKNHTGTDIAASTGTKIVSATDGTVILSSNKGDYGKHLKIKVNEVIIVYAHCSKLYVEEGAIVKQGQEIGEVGSTGNTTGPHLHFEVRYQDRYVDPQLILEL